MRFYFVAFWAIVAATSAFEEWDNLTLIKDRAVNTSVGPEEAVYCKLLDSAGHTVFDGFGRCKLALERVTADHSGLWKMMLGIPGRISTKHHHMNVTVREAEPKAVVSTSVVNKKPSVVLTCSVKSTHNVGACSFRNPKGTIFIATRGTTDTYIDFKSEVHDQGCSISFNPGKADLGLWRCAIDTEGDTYYGFLAVVSPWLIHDSYIPAAVTKPVLTVDRKTIVGLEGEEITMSCSIPAPIRYCYFRISNGTVFSVTPATSSPSLQYVGNGFDAGECGVRFRGLVSNDSGSWECRVGLYNQSREQRMWFFVIVNARLYAFHYIDTQYGLTLDARILAKRTLDYCRFVRIDGLGFTSDNLPYGFTFEGNLEEGICTIRIYDQSILNLHPWTVAVKIRAKTRNLPGKLKRICSRLK